jgi:2-methylcitrate dehydratase PrpD
VNDLSARFSIPFAAAIALMRGHLTATSIDDAALADPNVRDLASRIKVKHDPGLDAGYPAGRPARVIITMSDGTIHQSETSIARGDTANPMSANERHAKAASLFDLGLGHERTPLVLATLEELPRLTSLDEVSNALRARSKGFDDFISTRTGHHGS